MLAIGDGELSQKLKKHRKDMKAKFVNENNQGVEF
jgi:phosphoribosylcarboxyaminoimidazole (NCAIR) mutase